jgi:hypothetical protein
MKHMVNWLISGILFGCIAGLGLTGCGETEEAFNCAEICETYEDCADGLGADVDYTECVSSCENEADMDQNFAEKADSCASCLSAGDSCTGNYGCVDECAGVVPEVVL